MFDEEIISVANNSAQADRLVIESAVKECYEQHKAAWETWEKGEPVDHWFDENGALCIRYENGEWFHYKMCPGVLGQAPFLSWW